jgi:hypothetical protein
MCGPYDDLDSFVSAWYDNFDLRLASGCFREEPCEALWDSSLVEHFSRFKPLLSGTAERRPVLTHMDLAMKNIIARQIKRADGQDDWEVTFVDWDSFRWLPPYMQHASLREKTSFL